MPLTIRRKTKVVKAADAIDRRTNWNTMRERWIAQNMDGTVTLKDFAIAEGLNWGNIRNRSSEGRWADELERRRHLREKQVADAMVDRSVMAIETVKERLATDEASVRERQVRIAQALQAKAMQRLTSIPVEQLTARDSIELLRLGLAEERKGLGMPDERVDVTGSAFVVSRAQEIFEREMAKREGTRAQLAKALLILEGQDAVTVEPQKKSKGK